MEKFRRVSVLLLLCLLYMCFSLFLIPTVKAKVVLISGNVSFSFDDFEANFAPSIETSGEHGRLYVAEPLDGCSPLKNKINQTEDLLLPFVLIVRGGCTFEDKVRKAQNSGFKAAIVYDDVEDDALVAMAGSSSGIKIHAVFVSKRAGEILKMYAAFSSTEIWLSANFENSAWSIMAISFISLLAMSAVLATCFFVRRHRMRREMPRASNVREFHGMSSRLVKAMPSLIFTSVLEESSTSATCAICLEDYSVGEKLRVLPCRHKFHSVCVDAWLTTWRTFCPVCKRDAKTSTGYLPASERTPLLSSGASSLSSSSIASSFRSSIASSAIQISHGSPLHSPSVSRGNSMASSSYFPQSHRSYRNSPAVISPSRSSTDLRFASSQRSIPSHLLSSHSLGYPSLSSFNSRYISPYVASPSNASPSYIGSSSRYPCLLNYSASAASISPFASTHSLPGVEFAQPLGGGG